MKGKCLGVCFHDEVLVLVWTADKKTTDFIEEFGPPHGEPFCPEEYDFDYNVNIFHDGVFVADIKVVDDGPGDWPGSREWVPQIANWRSATAEEWKAHVRGEWPWPECDMRKEKAL